jgi:Bromodomain/Bromodomain extra-terminal - transcription regulation
VKLDLPSYPKIVKKPMDLSTMRKKLDGQEYNSAQRFYDDFKLMIRNCFAFNPPGTPVNQAGVELQRLFDEKWKGLPPFHDGSDDEYDEEEDDESYDERAREFLLLSFVVCDLTVLTAAILGTIAMMESQIETMKGSIAALKGKPAERKPKKEKKRERPTPVASSSKVSKPPKSGGGSGGGGNNKRKGKKPIADDDVLSFEQKKDLSEAIQKLDGNKLERVIQIIHEGVPEIRDVSCLLIFLLYPVTYSQAEHGGNRAGNRLAPRYRPHETIQLCPSSPPCARHETQQDRQGDRHGRTEAEEHGRGRRS